MVSVSSCEKLLSNECPSKDRVQYFIQFDFDGNCQNCKLSEHSPGTVSNDEWLARSIDFPLREDPVTGLNDSLFQDAFTLGASIQRVPRDWAQGVQAIHDRYEERASNRRSGGDGRTPNTEWRYIGVLQVTTNELRELQLDACFRKGRVRVYDAAHSPDDPLHADVMVDASDLTAALKAQRKLLRVMLMTVACRRGLFVSPYLAPDDPCLQNIQIVLHSPNQHDANTVLPASE